MIRSLHVAPHNSKRPMLGRTLIALSLCLAGMLAATPARCQDASDSTALKELLKRLESVEKRLSESEGALQKTTAELAEAKSRIQALESGQTAKPPVLQAALDPAPTPVAAQSPANPMAEHDHDAPPAAGANAPKLAIRGYGDVRFGKEAYAASPNSFALGQMDLYISSRLTEKTSVLMETVFEAGSDNNIGVDIERFLIQHRVNRYLKFDAGRNHTAIGYYNTAFHHGTWFQTATARPFLFAFEDEGGLLPVHTIGLRASGEIPSSGLGLQYTFEVGNGRSYQQGTESVQNRFNVGSGKSVNAAFSSSPDALPGLQIGGSAYHESLKWGGLQPIGQQVYSAYAVYDRGRIEFLNEGVLMQHTQAGRTTTIPGGYTQFAYRLSNWSPYGRFEYLNGNRRDPVAQLILPHLGVRRQASFGIRYDFNEFAALKFQYGRLLQDSLSPVNMATAQLAFTF